MHLYQAFQAARPRSGAEMHLYQAFQAVRPKSGAVAPYNSRHQFILFDSRSNRIMEEDETYFLFFTSKVMYDHTGSFLKIGGEPDSCLKIVIPCLHH
jgi:hypothetical protein